VLCISRLKLFARLMKCLKNCWARSITLITNTPRHLNVVLPAREFLGVLAFFGQMFVRVKGMPVVEQKRTGWRWMLSSYCFYSTSSQRLARSASMRSARSLCAYYQRCPDHAEVSFFLYVDSGYTPKRKVRTLMYSELNSQSVWRYPVIAQQIGPFHNHKYPSKGTPMKG